MVYFGTLICSFSTKSLLRLHWGPPVFFFNFFSIFCFCFVLRNKMKVCWENTLDCQIVNNHKLFHDNQIKERMTYVSTFYVHNQQAIALYIKALKCHEVSVSFLSLLQNCKQKISKFKAVWILLHLPFTFPIEKDCLNLKLKFCIKKPQFFTLRWFYAMWQAKPPNFNNHWRFWAFIHFFIPWKCKQK